MKAVDLAHCARHKEAVKCPYKSEERTALYVKLPTLCRKRSTRIEGQPTYPERLN